MLTAEHVDKLNIAELCNGSTADSDSACEGSNPSSAAMKKALANCKCFFQLYSPYGEWYCYAVIFGCLPSDIRFASVSDEYNINVPQAQYHFCVGKNITPSAAGHITISLQVKSLMI